MKNSGLYEIGEYCREEGGTFVCEVKINSGHEIFKGHFPEAPVLPGVCMLEIIKECLLKTIGKPLKYDFIKSCKFVSVIDPRLHQSLQVHFTLTNLYNLQAMLLAGEHTALKLKAILSEA